MIVAAAGALVLFGWALDIPLMRSVLPGAVQIGPMTLFEYVFACNLGIDLALARGGARPAVGKDPSPLGARS